MGDFKKFTKIDLYIGSTHFQFLSLRIEKLQILNQ